MRVLSIYLLLLCAGLDLTAQAFTIQGKILDCTTKSPISGVLVRLIEIEQWTTTNQQGEFVLNNIPIGRHTLETHCLGYISHIQTIYNINTIDVSICLKPSTYSIDEITVVETKGSLLSSSIIIGNEAIEHVQPSTLKDVLQLLPGASIENPDLSNPQLISIRDIGDDANSSFGAAIIVDGIPLTNDANMQTYSTTQISTNSINISQPATIQFPTTIGNGMDVRSISADRIESIEVITGIPSVTYGDLTSGAIVIKSKSGYTPWEAKLKSDPNLKMASVNKGFKLKNAGSVNAGIDYTYTYSDLRSKYDSYDRITGQVAYSKVLSKHNKPLSFNAKINAYSTIDQKIKDPDAMVNNEVLRSSDRGAQASIEGKWALDNQVISNLNYNFSASIAEQKSFQKTYRSGGIQKISSSLSEGENEGLYLPGESLTELSINGLPFSFYGQVYISKSSLLGENSSQNFIAGIEYRTKGNNGNGRSYDIENPPYISPNSTRPRTYKNIPNLSTFSAFLEEKISLAIGSTQLNLQAGARFNNFQPRNMLQSEIGWNAEPRLNAKYTILNKANSLIKHMAVSGGFGINYKSPSLMYIYPDKAYFDLVSLDRYTGNPETNMVIFDTRIFNTANPNLKPSGNTKKEVGIDVKIGKVSANITAYNELLTNGFGMLTNYTFVDYKHYDAQNVSIDEKPVIEALPYETKEYIIAYSQPVNNKETQKYGIEYTLNFEKINPLHTQISINGAWKKNEQTFSTVPVPHLPNNANSGQSEYVCVYAAGERKTSERLNTNFRFITHSTKLRLILTTTINLLWYDKYHFPLYSDAPDYLYNNDGIKIPFTQEMKNDQAYYQYLNQKSHGYYKTERMPFLPLCNIRISKELGKNTRLSFYANNFINHRPMYKYNRSDAYSRRNQSIYFGAELKISIQ